MLTKYKKVRPKIGVNKPFEKCFHAGGIGLLKNFFREGSPEINTTLSAVCSTELF